MDPDTHAATSKTDLIGLILFCLLGLTCLFGLIALIAPVQAAAEYRAFELVITDSTTGQERVEISNLTPNQYRYYYPVKATETVVYRATWRCRGNTSEFRPYCPKPDDKN